MNQIKNSLSSGQFINPRFDKKHKGGEDACCVNDRLIGVADGVGGWIIQGIDPAIYSNHLLKIVE